MTCGRSCARAADTAPIIFWSVLDLKKIRSSSQDFCRIQRFDHAADLFHGLCRPCNFSRSHGGEGFWASPMESICLVGSGSERKLGVECWNLDAEVKITGGGRQPREFFMAGAFPCWWLLWARRTRFGPQGTDSVYRRHRGQAIPDRSHADAIEAGGKVGRVRGIIFGEMVDCVQHKDQEYTLEEVVLRDCRGSADIPVAYGLRSGHVSRGNITLPFGVRAG